MEPEETKSGSKSGQIADFEVNLGEREKSPSRRQLEDKDSFCDLFLIYGLNHEKYINERKKTYEVLSSYPDIEANPHVAQDNNYI